MRCGDQPRRRRRQPPRADILPGRQRDQLIQDIGQILGPQSRAPRPPADRPPERNAAAAERAAPNPAPGAAGSDPTRADKHGQRPPRTRSRRSCRLPQLKQAVDQDRTEQLRRAARSVEDLTGSAVLLAGGRPGPRLGTVNPVQCLRQIPGRHNPPRPEAGGGALDTGARDGAEPSRRPPAAPPLSAPFPQQPAVGDRGQGRHFPRGVPIPTADAARLVGLTARSSAT